MTRHQTHLLLISAQAVPNLTPVLDRAFAPEGVILAVSPDMAERADWIEAVLRPRGVGVERCPIDDAWDLERTRDQLLDLMAEREGQDIALNATGGTKPMSIAAYEIFRQFDQPIFYVHPEQDRIIWLHPADRPTHALEDRIRLDAFFQAHGARVVNCAEKSGVPPELRELTAELIADNARLQRPLASLNWLASQAERRLQVNLDPGHRHPDLLDLIDRFGELDLLELRGDTLRFADEAARFYVNGGWFEEHVYSELFNLRSEIKGFQDLGRSIEVARQGPRGEIPNELDVAFLADNRLYLIECKTRNWRSNFAASAGADASYRLDALGDILGGLQARSMLISYYDLIPEDHQRARAMGIHTCAGRGVQRLRGAILEWVEKV
jgi:hypothetical protein